MFVRSHRSRRGGSSLLEAAFAYPVAILLVLGLTVVGMGVFRYLQVAELAREGARYASVHGGQWAADLNGGTLTTTNNIYNNAIMPRAAALNTNTLPVSNVTVTYADNGQMPTYTVAGKTTTNIVTVTVNYHWVPALYLGSMTLSSTSKMPISY